MQVELKEADLELDPVFKNSLSSFMSKYNLPMTLENLYRVISYCNRCGCSTSRYCLGSLRPIFVENPQVLIINKFSGNKDFEGNQVLSSNTPAGGVLDTMLNYIGYTREQAYVTNIVKCGIAKYGVTSDSITRCREFLKAEIALLPSIKVVFLLGTEATEFFYKMPISKCWDKVYISSINSQEVLVVPLYHPIQMYYDSYLENSPGELNYNKLNFVRRCLNYNKLNFVRGCLDGETVHSPCGD